MRPEIHSYGDLTYPDDMQYIIRNGFPKTSNPKKVTIVGAGMAGLVSASILKDAGHHVTIIEANDRIGGRIFTIRQSFTTGNYLDVGAMRFPNTHELVFEYIRKFNLPTNQFMNINENDLLFVNGIQTTVSYYEENPNVLNYPLPPEEQGKTANELLFSAVQPFLDLYNSRNPEEQEILREKFDRYSFDNFLRYNPIGKTLSPNAIRMINVLLGIGGFSQFSFVDILLDIVGTVFNEELKFYEITGGNDQLPMSFIPQLQNNIIYQQKVNQIFQQEEGVTVTSQNLSTGQYHSFHGDYMIMTVPYSAFQFIDVYPYNSFSYQKWKAIRELNYVGSDKIGLEFKSKFWEKSGIGNIITDFPIRFTYNPSHNIGESGPGVILASYSWGDNARLWNSLSEDERIREALSGLSKIYGEQVFREFLKGISFSWAQNPFSAGCFTLFTPNQATDISDAVHLPAGRVHFAGEHTSTFHGWVEGAIESGIRAAYEINNRID